MSDPQDWQFDDKAANILWEWGVREDQHIHDEFALAIVGLGALFFAYAQLHTESLKIIVALIGFAASIILWMDMAYARHEYRRILQLLAQHNHLFERFLEEKTSRGNFTFLTRRYYRPATVAMTYFMFLVTWAWAAIAAFRIFYVVLHKVYPQSPWIEQFMVQLGIGLFILSLVIVGVGVAYFAKSWSHYAKPYSRDS